MKELDRLEAPALEDMSLEELRAEGEAAGIPFARALARHALIRSLRDKAPAAAKAAAPSSPAPSSPAPEAPPPQEPSPGGITLRGLWVQARSLARAILDPAGPEPRPRPIAPSAGETQGGPAGEPVQAEPIRTRALAELLARQGHHRRALGILRHLLEGGEEVGLREEADRLASLLREQELPKALARAFPPGSVGLALRSIEGHLAALYQVDPTRIEGARSLLSEAERERARPALRVVRLAAGEDGALHNETQDVLVEGFSGACSLGAEEAREGTRTIVSIGLLIEREEGPRFVSMAHASTSE